MKCCHVLFPAVVIIIGNFLMMTNLTIVDVVESKQALPELTSTALRLHKVYANLSPHDTDLYDTLEVTPNATIAQIKKKYRTLTRKYHPDKLRTQQNHDQQKEVAERRLQQLQRAYEVLSNDSKRLPYHRYGLVDPNLAAFLLRPQLHPNSYYQLVQQHSYSCLSSNSNTDSGRDNNCESSLFDKLDRELLQLMGYDYSTMNVVTMAMEANPHDDPSNVLEEHRARTIAALLVESIRPVVEGRIGTRLYIHSLAQDCDKWKRSPLGAQIIRSVGRAYRHEGRDFLQRYKNLPNYWSKNHVNNNNSHNNNSKQVVRQLQTGLTINLRRRWRYTKDFWTAAAVSGRLAIADRSYNQQQQQHQERKTKNQSKRQRISSEAIQYHENEIENESSFLPLMDDYGHDDVNCYESMEELEEKHKEYENLKAQQTLLQALQIEALWKVVKIDLDRIVRRACAMILSGEYFFPPSYQSLDCPKLYNGGNDNNDSDSGWVTSSGETINLEHAIVAAAETIAMTGDIMVQQSKRGTSWK